jgi:hypothetical protein
VSYEAREIGVCTEKVKRKVSSETTFLLKATRKK